MAVLRYIIEHGGAILLGLATLFVVFLVLAEIGFQFAIRPLNAFFRVTDALEPVGILLEWLLFVVVAGPFILLFWLISRLFVLLKKLLRYVMSSSQSARTVEGEIDHVNI